MRYPSQSYQNIMTIVHGKSEESICSSIKSNLRLPQEIISRAKGKSSIQITSVMDILNDSRFKTPGAFKKSFPRVDCDRKGPLDFRLFIIMDTDDCTEQEKKIS